MEVYGFLNFIFDLRAKNLNLLKKISAFNQALRRSFIESSFSHLAQQALVKHTICRVLWAEVRHSLTLNVFTLKLG